jgi:phosphatidylglycerophosphate synthase
MQAANKSVRTKHYDQWIKECHRFVGDHLAAALINTPLTPTHLTIFRFLCAVVAAGLIALNWGHASLIVAAIGIYLFAMIDNADGSLAVLKKNGTLVGAWVDRQADGLSFLLVFSALAVRFSFEGTAGTYWAILAIAVFAIGLLNKTTEIALRTKKELQGISGQILGAPQNGGNLHSPSNPQRQLSWTTMLKRQISPDFQTILFILMVGLALNELKIMLVVLLAFLSLWWIARTVQVFRLARKYDIRAAAILSPNAAASTGSKCCCAESH